MSDFYLTLPSHSNKNEFPHNASNHFKIRLPHPIRLEGSGWKVGLSAIALPDSQVSIPPLVTAQGANPTLAKYEWIRINSASSTTAGVGTFDADDVDRVFDNVDGIGFMKSMIAFFQQRRIYNNDGPLQGAKYLTDQGKKSYVNFFVEGEDLVIDNRFTIKTKDLGSRPKLLFNQELAKKMGWIEGESVNGHTKLGPNIEQVFVDDTIPTLNINTADVFDAEGNPVFWTLHAGMMELSIYCNWRLINVNKAFEVVVGRPSRSLFVYSDVGGSGVVGNQVTDLLREVHYQRQGKGSHYYEPLHIQYIPVRKDVIDIIETQVAETTGALTEFGAGNTIVTLHFKKT